MSKLCAECKYFEIRDVPDGMNMMVMQTDIPFTTCGNVRCVDTKSRAILTT